MNWCCFQKSPYSDPFLFVSLLERKSQIMLFLNSNPSDGFSSQSKIIALLYKTQHDLTTRYLLNIYGVFFKSFYLFFDFGYASSSLLLDFSLVPSRGYSLL